MSPTICLGFYCKTLRDLDEFFNSVEEIKKRTDSDKVFSFISRITPNSMIVGNDESEIIML